MRLENASFPILLVENKVDLIKDYISTNEEFTDFSEQNNFVASYRVSAKTGYNVSESIEFLIKYIVKKIELTDLNNDNVSDRTHFNINEMNKYSCNHSNCC